VQTLTVISQKESLRGHPKPGVDSDVSAWSRLSLSPLTDFVFARSRLTLFATRTVSFFAEEHYFFSAASPVWSCLYSTSGTPPSFHSSESVSHSLAPDSSLPLISAFHHSPAPCSLAFFLFLLHRHGSAGIIARVRACVRTHNVYACIHTCTRVRYFPVTWASGMP